MNWIPLFYCWGSRLLSPALLAVLVPLILLVAIPCQAGSQNSLMDISRNGKLLACSNRDSGTVTILDLQSHRKLHEIPVGHHPEGVSFLGASEKLAVAVYNDDEIVFLDARSGKISAQVAVFDEPYGVVSNSSGSRIYVTLDYPGRVIEIDAQKQTLLREFSAGQFLRGLAISSDDQHLWTTEYYSGRVAAVDVAAGQVVEEWTGGSNDNLLRQVTLHPQRPKAYLPHIRSRTLVAHGAGSIFPLISVLDLSPLENSRRRKRIPMDSFIGNRVTCNPWETAITPDGQTLLVVFAGTDDLFVCNVLDDDYRELTYRTSLSLGHNPRAVRIAPDGKTFYVYNALNFEVVSYDTETLQKLKVYAVTENPLSEQVLLGKRLFYTAHQPMSGQRWISCASCHPDGQPDQRTWQNPEGLRNTQALAGLAWTHPIHWSADRDEVQDFEHTIRGPLMQGQGLLKGTLAPALEQPNRKLSNALDALAAYSNTHDFTLSPHAREGLSAAALRGKKLFFSSETQCATCHSGPFYTDSHPQAVPFILHDVGTGREDPSELMGFKYDTPTLLGVYRTAPYLHDGRAQTLTEVLTTQNPQDRHGKTQHLTPEQIQDLVEFLKALPYEDPTPAAQAAGLIKMSH